MHTNLIWIFVVFAGLALATWSVVRLWHYRMTFTIDGITFTITDSTVLSDLRKQFIAAGNAGSFESFLDAHCVEFIRNVYSTNEKLAKELLLHVNATKVFLDALSHGPDELILLVAKYVGDAILETYFDQIPKNLVVKIASGAHSRAAGLKLKALAVADALKKEDHSR